MKKKKKGFTLAEVLITLAVIGVVSALTIPTLVQKTNKQEYVSALQKAYSTLSQATNMIIAENGSPKGEDGWTGISSEHIYNLYKKHLNNAKECGNEGGCFNQGKLLYLNGNEYGTWNTASSYSASLVLTDGMQIMFASGTIYVDVNGASKPNKFGRDIFGFGITDKGLLPMGCEAGVSDDCNTKQGGWTCACKVLREGAMNY